MGPSNDVSQFANLYEKTFFQFEPHQENEIPKIIKYKNMFDENSIRKIMQLALEKLLYLFQENPKHFDEFKMHQNVVIPK
jgi:hypothetical protein